MKNVTKKIQEDNYSNIIDKYDLRVVKIFWFTMGFMIAVIIGIAILMMYDKI